MEHVAQTTRKTPIAGALKSVSTLIAQGGAAFDRALTVYDHELLEIRDAEANALVFDHLHRPVSRP